MLYLDSSALIKRYVAEMGTTEVGQAITHADVVSTVVLSRAEVAAALAKAVRMNVLTEEEAQGALQVFRSEWPNLLRVQVTEMLVARAGALAWQHGLRGYDAVHLAGALLWQEAIGEVVTLATFDRRLWQVAREVGLPVVPDELMR
ncbi:MAG: type II toxin-antitoxin system VapC family toxin [Anaerolineae bacterium]